MCDIGYLGLQRTLGAVQPLLQTTKANRHATILMNFLNAVRETVKAAGPDAETPDVNFLFSYLPKPQLFTWPMEHNADVLRIWDARDLAADVESLFKRYGHLF